MFRPARGGPGDGLYHREQPAYDQQPQRSSNPRWVSKWSDGPPGQASAATASAQDANPSTDRRPSPTGLEPPYKKVRNNLPQGSGNSNLGQVTGDQRDDGYGKSPAGSHALLSAAAVGQRYEDFGGGESYGMGYGGQQMYGHGQGMPQMSGFGGQQMSSHGQGVLQTSGYGQGMPQTSSHSQGMLQSYGLPVGFAPGSAKGTGSLFFKTKLCTKFKLGTCTFNERCHFAHGMEDLRKPPSGWETMVGNAKEGSSFTGRTGDGGLQQRRKTAKPCRYFADGKICPYGDRCTFLHGDEDAQQTPGAGNFDSGGMSAVSNSNYKTLMCARWERGEPCNYGERCHYAHGHAELQRYMGVASYSNSGVAVATKVQHSSAKPEMAPNLAVYSDPNIINPSPRAAPYGASLNFASSNAPAPAPAAPANLNFYSTAGTGAQDGTNGSSGNLNYWDGAPTQQGYVQANETAGPWTGNYLADKGYSKDHVSAIQYTQDQSQQQQSVPFHGSGSAGVYQDTKKSVSASYGQDGSWGNYQREATNGNGGYYNPAYEANHPNQQADNSGRYSMAETWAGKM